MSMLALVNSLFLLLITSCIQSGAICTCEWLTWLDAVSPFVQSQRKLPNEKVDLSHTVYAAKS